MTRKKISMNKIEKVMKEFKSGKLHSGSKKGPEVRSRKQAVAIGMSEARKGSYEKALICNSKSQNRFLH